MVIILCKSHKLLPPTMLTNMLVMVYGGNDHYHVNITGKQKKNSCPTFFAVFFSGGQLSSNIPYLYFYVPSILT